MAYTRPKSNYRPLQYTPQSYNPPPYEPLPYDQKQPDEEFYKKLLEGTKAPTPPPEPESNYLKRYEEITGRTPNRLAYQQAVQEGYPEIERGKLSKALALIGAVGGTWATKDPAASTKAAMDAYFTPQNRATARYKEKLSGLENLATMEDKDIAGKIRALEFERGEHYDRERLRLEKERDRRAAEGDTLENERKRILLDDAKVEKRVDDDTGIEYRRPKGSNGEWTAFAKVKPAKVEDIAYGALEAGEKKKAEEAALQPGRMALAGANNQTKIDIANARDKAAADRLKQRIQAEIGKPNATEEYRQRMSNLQEALILDPSLSKYVKEGPGGMLIPRGPDDYWFNPDPEDLAGIKKVQEAMTAGPKKPATQTPAAGTTKYPQNPDGTVTIIQSTTGREERIPAAEVDDFLANMPGTKVKAAGTQTQSTQSSAQENITVAPEAPKPASVTPPKEPVAPYQASEVEEGAALPFGSSSPFSGFGKPYSTTTPRPANNPFANMAQDATVEPAPMGAPPPQPQTQMPIAPELLQRNRFGPANVFGANIPLPGANPQERMPPPQAPPQQPPIDLMPAPQPQRVGGPPQSVAPQRPPLPMNPIQLGPPVDTPMAPPPPVTPQGVPPAMFGPRQAQPATPLGRASAMSSELTNPISLRQGLMAPTGGAPWDAPKPAPKAKIGPAPVLPPGSRTPVPPKMRVPERVKDFNTRLEALKAQFKQETGYDIRIDRGGNVSEVDQYKKYLQGRPELPGGTEGPKVTPLSGKPGNESTHQFGEGADVIFIDKNGKQVDYIDKTKKHQPPNKLGERLYGILGRIAEQKGLEWGGDWKGAELDWPHVQLPQPKKATSTTESKNIGKKGKR